MVCGGGGGKVKRRLGSGLGHTVFIRPGYMGIVAIFVHVERNHEVNFF